MKKILFVSFLALSFSFVKAQDSVLFKIKYLPNHTYQLGGNTSISLYADLSGNKELASKLATQGIAQPMNVILQFNTNGTTTTSSIGAENSFAVDMKVSAPTMSGTLNGKQIPIPIKKSNTEFYGRVNSEGKLSIDSLNGQKLNDSATIAAKKMMNKIMGMVNFPEHAIKVGDSFTQDIPFDLPVAKGMTINIEMTYKLIKITDGKAYFDIKQGLDMQMPMKQINISITGTGLGKMVYDIKNNFPVSLNSNLFMTINLKSDKFSGGATANITTNSTYVIN
jgi:hypothetical protein